MDIYRLLVRNKFSQIGRKALVEIFRKLNGFNLRMVFANGKGQES